MGAAFYMNDKPIYLTAEGLKKIKNELTELKAKLREIADRIDRAKELGDLSENAEYHEAKDDYAFTAGKIMELENAVNRASVISQQKQSEIVQIGSTVKILDKNGQEKEYTLVGPNEADPVEGRLSYESPLAQAFLGRKPGDKVEVKTPGGPVSYTILEIK